METESTYGQHRHDTQVPPRRPGNTIRGTIREWLQVIIIALLISLPIRFFIAEPFVVNGASMDPTFSTGQFLIVDRLTYRFEEPKRGDVIVFKYPNNPSTYFIKRIIGLPGETVSIKNGIVTIINTESPTGTVLDETYVDSSHRSHENTSSILGPDQYFVMGDNRAQSSDSRIWGALDKGLIAGRPIVRLLPVTQLSLLPGIYHEYAQSN
jgi:signal peptidase I